MFYAAIPLARPTKSRAARSCTRCCRCRGVLLAKTTVLNQDDAPNRCDEECRRTTSPFPAEPVYQVGYVGNQVYGTARIRPPKSLPELTLGLQVAVDSGVSVMTPDRFSSIPPYVQARETRRPFRQRHLTPNLPLLSHFRRNRLLASPYIFMQIAGLVSRDFHLSQHRSSKTVL